MKHCQHCRAELVRRHGEYPSIFKRRQFCSHACAMAARTVPTAPRVCNRCGREYQRRAGEYVSRYLRRKVCSRRCAGGSSGGPHESNRNRLENLEWLLKAGTPVQEVPARLGTTPVALARWLHRYGHHEYGRLFGRANVRRAA